MSLIQYPTFLDKIFEKLNKYNIKPVIVGGYIRDYLLRIDSKDIDIELYRVKNLETLPPLLSEFGEVNLVGKSFGVVKLHAKEFEIDFSLPRTESNTAQGHKDFHITTYEKIDFATAARRRDFTINAIGYDVAEHKLLDPFGGVEDLEHKILKAVDIHTFVEDPLRVLRAIQFVARFELQIDDTLLFTCKEMVQHHKVLSHLPKERIFGEIQKLLLKASKPSTGILLMQKMGMFDFFEEFAELDAKSFQRLLERTDKMKKLLDTKKTSQKKALLAMLSTLSCSFSLKSIRSFLRKITDDKAILNTLFTLHHYLRHLDYNSARKVDMELLELFLEAAEVKNKKEILLHVKPKIGGKELIEQGLAPSASFTKILEDAYKEQLRRVHPSVFADLREFQHLQ